MLELWKSRSATINTARERYDYDIHKARAVKTYCNGLLNRFESVWQFAHVEGVEPTNKLQSANFGNW